MKKKKTATKTGKKIGKKMRGGDVEINGILSLRDFIFDIGSIDDFKREQRVNEGYVRTPLYIVPKSILKNNDKWYPANQEIDNFLT